MKLLSVILLLSFILVSPLWAQVPPTDTILASLSLAIREPKPETLLIEKVRRGEEIFLQARSGSAAPFWTSDCLGSEDKKFLFDGKPVTLISCDLDSDKHPELLTAAFYGPKASGLYGFIYQPTTRTFSVISCKYPNPDDNRDLLVSDVHEEDGSDFIITSDGKIRVLGIIYPTTEGQEPKPGTFHFSFQKGAFHAGSIEPLSEPDK